MRTTTNDLNRRDALIEAHRNYATALAREIAETLPRHVDFEELEAAAWAGLVEVADRFDPTNGARFSTFAYYRIRGAVWDCIRKSTWLPPALRRKARMELDFCRLAEAERHADPAASFRAAIRTAGAVVIASDFVNSGRDLDDRHGADDGLDGAERAEVLDRVNSAVENLPQPQRDLIDLIVRQNLSQTQVAARRGVDKSTIHRQWHATVQALRSSLPAERD